jgi:hypothetical protein
MEHMTARKRKTIDPASAIIDCGFEFSEQQRERPISDWDHLYTDIFVISSLHECSKSRTPQGEN